MGCSAHPEQQHNLIVESLPHPLPISTKRLKTCQPQLSSFYVKTDSAAASQLDLIARFFYMFQWVIKVDVWGKIKGTQLH